MSAIYPSSTLPRSAILITCVCAQDCSSSAGSYQRPNWVFASSTGISSCFCLIVHRSWRWLGAKGSWSSISDCKEYGIRVNPKNAVRTRRRPPKLISTPASPPRASPISPSTIWGWIWYPGDWVLFIEGGFIYVGMGVKWAMVSLLVLISFIWLIVYTYLGISIVPPPPLDLPQKQQGELSQRSRPDHRRFHQHRISLLPRHRPALCTI